MTEVDPKVSQYFSELAKKRTDNKRGFSSPEVVKKAIETRKRNALKKAQTKNDTET